MKRLQAIIFLAILICSAPAMAQYGVGSIGMYTSGSANDDCDRETYVIGQLYDVWFWCMLDPGAPDGIKGFQFKAEVTKDPTIDDVVFDTPQWNFENVPVGNIATGLAVTISGGQCYGTGETVFTLGYVPIRIIGTGAAYIHLVPDPSATPLADVLIMSCETGYPQYKMRGGWYVFGATCSTDSEETSWGAIKSIYSD